MLNVHLIMRQLTNHLFVHTTTLHNRPPLLYQVIFTITGREEVDLLDFFFIVCGVPGSFSACALLIILTG